MSTIDVREIEPAEITCIQFDELDECDPQACQLCFSSADGVTITDGYDSIVVTNSRGLINALAKAVELGWFKKV